MTYVGMAGMLLGFLFILPAMLQGERLLVGVLTLLYLIHIGSSLFYYSLVSGGGADSALYYFDAQRLHEDGFGFSTQFVIYITQSLKSMIGGTYLDFFLVYQAFGFFGIVLLTRIAAEIYEAVGVQQPLYIYIFFFLPSLHYWTSAIGKDTLFFLGMMLCLWGSMRFWNRLGPLSVGVFLMLAIRPHIAIVAMSALAIAVFSDKTTRLSVRITMLSAALIGLVFAVSTVWSTFNLDLTNLDTYSDVVAGREALLQMDVSVIGRTSVDAPFPIRVLSLLFRPFFFDANDILGIVVSIENAGLAIIIGAFLFKWRVVAALVKSVPYVRFAFISSVAILMVLSLGYYNVGLGIRQKATMILPGLLVVAMTLAAVLDARRRQLRQSSPGGAPSEVPPPLRADAVAR
jgi:hypothetical protein